MRPMQSFKSPRWRSRPSNPWLGSKQSLPKQASQPRPPQYWQPSLNIPPPVSPPVSPPYWEAYSEAYSAGTAPYAPNALGEGIMPGGIMPADIIGVGNSPPAAPGNRPGTAPGIGAAM